MSDESETMSKKSRKATSPTISDDEYIEPPAFSLATLGLRRVGSAPPPKPQPQQPIQMLNARGMPARIRKPNRLFFDDDIINDDKPLRMSLSPRKMPIKAVASPHKTPTKVLKKRKGVVSRYMRSEEKKKATEVTTPTTRERHTSASNSSISNTPKSSTRLSGMPIASTSSAATVAHIIPADKKIGQSIGLRLRNLLKLPKAHRWVIFEWFYSFIDKALFEGENDFQVCLTESFPNLNTRHLTRAEWRKVRSLMGKPRRCSQAFFEEERRELERRRQKIRYIQSRKSGDIKDLNYVRDLPEKIPLSLPIGTKVTARLRVPQDGIFSGTVDAFDSMTSTYRITFDRNGLGTHSIPDFEIVSENFHEMVPLQSITRDNRPNLMSIFNGVSSSPLRNVRSVRTALNMNLNKSDPVLAQVNESPFKDAVLGRDNINGYPAKLLETLVRLKRALASKRSKLQRLSEMNNEAELKASQQLAAAHSNSNSSSDESQNTNEAVPQLSEEFQRRYASIVISMEKMNRDMQDYLNDVQAFAGDLTRDPQVQAMLAPSYLREKCRETAEDAVQTINQSTVQNKSVLALIKNLATVLLVASHLGNDGNAAEVSKVLEGCIEEVRSSLSGVNVETFQKNVQIHLHHVRMLTANSNVMMSNSAISTGGGPLDR
ncbi:protein lin-9 homolog [Ceratitis capitata]|uniref:protein lin-9 homolog n=1 Tax=Ceratitis capitata TaxID=7213 RepID=UPI0003297CB6|nr:protein lin-9 homolog [Ceratitis capitata]